jgi:hypothetical protein
MLELETKRKIIFDDDEEYTPTPPPKKSNNRQHTEILCKPKIFLENLPEIKTLDQLIKIGETNKFYKNIK